MGDNRAFIHLLAPGRIGSLALHNRIVMAPMGSNLAEPGGYVGERIIRYYEERARGGVGLIIVGVGAIAYPAGACIPNQVAISDDVFLPGLQAVTARVHAHGAKIAIQLQHSGKVATQDMAVGRPMWVPSVPPPKGGDLLSDLSAEEIRGVTAYLTKPASKMSFHAMTAADIDAAVTMFTDAAERARRAGFDAVEIHAAHGYLIASFLSAAINTRTDEYGGPLEHRARFLVQVIEAVKRRVGADFPVWCRLDAKEFRVDNGITVGDAQRTAELAEAAGVDAIHVSAYADPTSGVAFTDAPLVHEPAGYVELAAGIKRRVKVPIIAVGRIEAELADDIIGAGKVDFVAMARKLLADPELPKKLAEGRREDIRPCVYCYTCVGKIYLSQPTCCAANPATGREAECVITPAERPRRVLVVGGGPAGMEAARVAALRGHHVTLCEQRERLGGMLGFAAQVYEPIGRLLAYLETQIRKLPVDVRLQQEATPALVRALGPDVIVVATGARRATLAIPGVDRANVSGEIDPRQLMTGIGTHRRIAIVGGGLIGIELAGFLSAREREVTVLEEGDTLAPEMALPRRWRTLHTLREHGVTLVTDVRVEAITDAGVIYVVRGERMTADADAVVIAAGMQPDPHVAEALSGLGAEVHLIGDGRRLGYIEGALLDAGRVARVI